MFWNKPKTCAECEKLRRDFKELLGEWESWQDKMLRTLARLRMRDTRAAEPTATAEPDGVGPESNGEVSRGGLTRAERIRRLQERVR